MLYFVRHGESEANVKDIFSGQRNDSPLTEKGRQQAALAGQAIIDKGLTIHHILTSPLSRTKDTAEIIARTIGFAANQIQVDARLAEYDMGDLTGQPHAQISSAKLIAANNAEPVTDFHARVAAAVADAKRLDGDTLIVGHAGVGRAIESTRLQADPKNFYDLPPYPNAQIIELETGAIL